MVDRPGFGIGRLLFAGLVIALLWVFGWGACIPHALPWLDKPEPAARAPGIVYGAERVIAQGNPPSPVLMGWAGQEVAAQALRELRPQVFAYSPHEWQAIAAKRVILWPQWRATNKGQDPPNFPQPVGDCVSRGWSHGLEAALATRAVLTGQWPDEFVRVYPPYIYGISRAQIGGGGIGGDGSVGAWAAKGVEKYGVLAWTSDCPKYEANNIRAWGRSGPPSWAIERARKYPAEVRFVTDFESACVAISQGWAVPVCSNVGYGKIVEANGRIEGRESGSWAHCMVFLGFDSRPGFEALYCYNSWGPNAHARAERYATLDAAPPGGFWVPMASVNRMLRQQDSYAVSFGGFSQSQILRSFQVVDSFRTELKSVENVAGVAGVILFAWLIVAAYWYGNDVI